MGFDSARFFGRSGRGGSKESRMIVTRKAAVVKTVQMAVMGQSGQAEGLMTLRRRQTASPNGYDNKPVPVTPDSATSDTPAALLCSSRTPPQRGRRIWNSVSFKRRIQNRKQRQGAPAYCLHKVGQIEG
jgi:hypothetical protein